MTPLEHEEMDKLKARIEQLEGYQQALLNEFVGRMLKLLNVDLAGLKASGLLPANLNDVPATVHALLKVVEDSYRLGMARQESYRSSLRSSLELSLGLVREVRTFCRDNLHGQQEEEIIELQKSLGFVDPPKPEAKSC